MINHFKTVWFISLVFSLACESQTEVVILKKSDNGQSYLSVQNPSIIKNKSIHYVMKRKDNPLDLDSPFDTLKSFQSIMDICTDDSGNIFVPDARTGSIKKFDKNGKFQYSVGSLGQGPGEFVKIYDISVFSGKLVVVDEPGKVEIFSTVNGKRIGGFPLTGMPTSVASSSTGIYVAMVGGPGVTEDIKQVACKYDYDGKLLFSIGAPRAPISDKFTDMSKFVNAFIKNISAIALDENENLYVAYWGQPYLIEKYNSAGKIILEFTRKLPYKVSKAGQPDLDGKPSPGSLMCIDIETNDDKIFVTVGGGWGRSESQRNKQLSTPFHQHIDVFDTNGVLLDSFWDKSLPKAAMGYQLSFQRDGSLMLSDGWYGNSYCYDLIKK